MCSTGQCVLGTGTGWMALGHTRELVMDSPKNEEGMTLTWLCAAKEPGQALSAHIAAPHVAPERCRRGFRRYIALASMVTWSHDNPLQWEM